jgi:hypothetical protein
MKPRKLTAKDVVFAVECLPEDIPVRGNAMASDEPELDKKVEDEIIARLDSGDLWAWCCVKVTATLECVSQRKGYVPTDVSLVGVDYLGGCSYRDEGDFREGGYFADMKDAALDDLQAQVDALAKKVAT